MEQDLMWYCAPGSPSQPVHLSTARGYCQVKIFNSVPLLSTLVLLQAPSTSCFSTVYIFCPLKYCSRHCQVMLFYSVPLLSTSVLLQASARSCFFSVYLSCTPKYCSRLCQVMLFDSVPLLSTQVLCPGFSFPACPPQYCSRLLTGHAFLQRTSPVHLRLL